MFSKPRVRFATVFRSSRCVRSAALLLATSACAGVQADAQSSMAAAVASPVGLHSYVAGHAVRSDPPDRIGGPLTVQIDQDNGSTRFILPGPRFMDPSVFGTPDQPAGFEDAPFPLLGVPLDMRNQMDGKYTFVAHATPFSDWREVGSGSVHMRVVDATAVDGARTKDTVDFEATFQTPDGAHYRVVCKKALPHGMAFPDFGGVVTNHLLHGASGVGTRLMPTEYTYAAFWGVGDIYKEGKLINQGQMIHAMVTEIVRGDNYSLDFDDAVGDPPQGLTLHLMIPKYKPTPKGLVEAPLMTGFMPFPFVKKHMQAAMAAAQQLPEPQRAKKLLVLAQVKEMMGKTKEHVMAATKAGTMNGMPFFHVMFGNIRMTASH